ncbi:hypothetical protein [Derxia lacustris]|uniref:hypothetical protein n=1 Tax=Derxia lacustris TaxID=764842 RepID=UPI00111C13A2|nr:hypothetical protein [Derxia lacustris]
MKERTHAARTPKPDRSHHAAPALAARSRESSQTAPTALALSATHSTPLVHLLVKESLRRQQNIDQLARELDCQPLYLRQLAEGTRSTEHVGQAFAESCSRYLRVPTALVKLWSGRLRLTDFDWPATALEALHPQHTIAILREDPVLGPLVPPSLDTAPAELQSFIATMYAESTGNVPTSWLAMPRALDCLQRAALGEDAFEKKLSSAHTREKQQPQGQRRRNIAANSGCDRDAEAC